MLIVESTSRRSYCRNCNFWKGITVHSIDCFSLEKFHDTPERWLDISWEREKDILYRGKLIAVLMNEPGSLADVTRIISSINGNISIYK